MQAYREDWPEAVRTGDDSILKKYDRMVIKNRDGVQDFPETDVDKLSSYWNGLTVRERNRFEAKCINRVKAKAGWRREAVCSMRLW
jgi:hypothetical protein